jgi:hypothetical protein
MHHLLATGILQEVAPGPGAHGGEDRGDLWHSDEIYKISSSWSRRWDSRSTITSDESTSASRLEREISIGTRQRVASIS